MDDTGSENLALRAEHGLSYWVEAGGRRFLFDCGQGAATMANARRLGVGLASADFTICSHSHYDHAAGFRDMAEAGCGGKLLYTGPGFWERKYARDGLKYTDLSAGFDENFLAERRVVHCVCGGLLEVAERCWLVGACTILKKSRSASLKAKRLTVCRTISPTKSALRWIRSAAWSCSSAARTPAF